MIKKGNNIRFGNTIFVIENFDQNSYLLSNKSTNEINWISKKDLIDNLEPITFKVQTLSESSNTLKKTYFKNDYIKILILENKNNISKIKIITESETYSKVYPYSTNRTIYEFNKFFKYTNELTPSKLKKYGFLTEEIFYATQWKDDQGDDVFFTILKNPTKKEFNDMLKNSKNKQLRAIVGPHFNDDIYVWDAYYGTHDNIFRRYIYPVDKKFRDGFVNVMFRKNDYDIWGFTFSDWFNKLGYKSEDNSTNTIPKEKWEELYADDDLGLLNEFAYQYDILYHGTNDNFNEFKKEYQKGGYLGKGFYFTMSKSMAQSYGPNIMSVKLKNKNSFFFSSDVLSEQQVREMLNTTNAQDYQKESMLKKYQHNISNMSYYNANSQLFDFVDALNGDSTAVLEKYGYDSIDNIERDSEIVVFNPTQIEILSKEKLNESAKNNFNDNFWKWFGNSCVKDRNGNPLKVYHGTTFKFNEFKALAGDNSDEYVVPAIYFSSNKSIAKSYMKSIANSHINSNSSNLIEAYIKIEHPYIIDVEKSSFNQINVSLRVNINYAYKHNYDGVIIRRIRDNMSQKGKGGAIADTYIVFNPNQIKAVSNNGNYSLNSNNIYESLNKNTNFNLSNENSLNQPIAKNEESLKKFYNWFGDSKTVDKQGRPLVLYHGTNADFNIFDIKKFGQSDVGYLGKGFYLTNDFNMAESYADTDFGKIMPLYAKIQKPFIITDRNISFYPEIMRAKLGVKTAKEITDKLTFEGYDGVILQYTEDDGSIFNEILVFNPNQIKAVNNNGEWDSNSYNIYETK